MFFFRVRIAFWGLRDDENIEEVLSSLLDMNSQFDGVVDGADIDYVIEVVEDVDQIVVPSSMPTPTSQPGSLGRHKKKIKINVLWKTKILEMNNNQLRFTVDDKIARAILELGTPIEFFSNIFPKEL